MDDAFVRQMGDSELFSKSVLLLNDPEGLPAFVEGVTSRFAAADAYLNRVTTLEVVREFDKTGDKAIEVANKVRANAVSKASKDEEHLRSWAALAVRERARRKRRNSISRVKALTIVGGSALRRMLEQQEAERQEQERLRTAAALEAKRAREILEQELASGVMEAFQASKITFPATSVPVLPSLDKRRRRGKVTQSDDALASVIVAARASDVREKRLSLIGQVATQESVATPEKPAASVVEGEAAAPDLLASVYPERAGGAKISVKAALDAYAIQEELCKPGVPLVGVRGTLLEELKEEAGVCLGSGDASVRRLFVMDPLCRRRVLVYNDEQLCDVVTEQADSASIGDLAKARLEAFVVVLFLEECEAHFSATHGLGSESKDDGAEAALKQLHGLIHQLLLGRNASPKLCLEELWTALCVSQLSSTAEPLGVAVSAITACKLTHFLLQDDPSAEAMLQGCLGVSTALFGAVPMGGVRSPEQERRMGAVGRVLCNSVRLLLVAAVPGADDLTVESRWGSLSLPSWTTLLSRQLERDATELIRGTPLRVLSVPLRRALLEAMKRGCRTRFAELSRESDAPSDPLLLSDRSLEMMARLLLVITDSHSLSPFVASDEDLLLSVLHSLTILDRELLRRLQAALAEAEHSPTSKKKERRRSSLRHFVSGQGAVETSVRDMWLSDACKQKLQPLLPSSLVALQASCRLMLGLGRDKSFDFARETAHRMLSKQMVHLASASTNLSDCIDNIVRRASLRSGGLDHDLRSMSDTLSLVAATSGAVALAAGVAHLTARNVLHWAAHSVSLTAGNDMIRQVRTVEMWGLASLLARARGVCGMQIDDHCTVLWAGRVFGPLHQALSSPEKHSTIRVTAAWDSPAEEEPNLSALSERLVGWALAADTATALTPVETLLNVAGAFSCLLCAHSGDTEPLVVSASRLLSLLEHRLVIVDKAAEASFEALELSRSAALPALQATKVVTLPWRVRLQSVMLAEAASAALSPDMASLKTTAARCRGIIGTCITYALHGLNGDIRTSSRGAAGDLLAVCRLIGRHGSRTLMRLMDVGRRSIEDADSVFEELLPSIGALLQSPDAVTVYIACQAIVSATWMGRAAEPSQRRDRLKNRVAAVRAGILTRLFRWASLCLAGSAEKSHLPIPFAAGSVLEGVRVEGADTPSEDMSTVTRLQLLGCVMAAIACCVECPQGRKELLDVPPDKALSEGMTLAGWVLKTPALPEAWSMACCMVNSVIVFSEPEQQAALSVLGKAKVPLRLLANAISLLSLPDLEGVAMMSLAAMLHSLTRLWSVNPLKVTKQLERSGQHARLGSSLKPKGPHVPADQPGFAVLQRVLLLTLTASQSSPLESVVRTNSRLLARRTACASLASMAHCSSKLTCTPEADPRHRLLVIQAAPVVGDLLLTEADVSCAHDLLLAMANLATLEAGQLAVARSLGPTLLTLARGELLPACRGPAAMVLHNAAQNPSNTTFFYSGQLALQAQEAAGSTGARVISTSTVRITLPEGTHLSDTVWHIEPGSDPVKGRGPGLRDRLSIPLVDACGQRQAVSMARTVAPMGWRPWEMAFAEAPLLELALQTQHAMLRDSAPAPAITTVSSPTRYGEFFAEHVSWKSEVRTIPSNDSADGLVHVPLLGAQPPLIEFIDPSSLCRDASAASNSLLAVFPSVYQSSALCLEHFASDALPPPPSPLEVRSRWEGGKFSSTDLAALSSSVRIVADTADIEDTLAGSYVQQLEVSPRGPTDLTCKGVPPQVAAIFSERERTCDSKALVTSRRVLERSFNMDWDRIQERDGFRAVRFWYRQGETDVDLKRVLLQRFSVVWATFDLYSAGSTADGMAVDFVGFSRLLTDCGVFSEPASPLPRGFKSDVSPNVAMLGRSKRGVRISPRDAIQIFVAANKEVQAVSKTNRGLLNALNPDNCLIRFEWMELLVRVASARYATTGEEPTVCASVCRLLDSDLGKANPTVMPWTTGLEPTESPRTHREGDDARLSGRSLEEHPLLMRAAQGHLDALCGDHYRRDRLYHISVAEVIGRHQAALAKIHSVFSLQQGVKVRNGEVRRSLTEQDDPFAVRNPWMSLDGWLWFLAGAGFIEPLHADDGEEEAVATSREGELLHDSSDIQSVVSEDWSSDGEDDLMDVTDSSGHKLGALLQGVIPQRTEVKRPFVSMRTSGTLSFQSKTSKVTRTNRSHGGVSDLAVSTGLVLPRTMTRAKVLQAHQDVEILDKTDAPGIAQSQSRQTMETKARLLAGHGGAESGVKRFPLTLEDAQRIFLWSRCRTVNDSDLRRWTEGTHLDCCGFFEALQRLADMVPVPSDSEIRRFLRRAFREQGRLVSEHSMSRHAKSGKMEAFRKGLDVLAKDLESAISSQRKADLEDESEVAGDDLEDSIVFPAIAAMDILLTVQGLKGGICSTIDPASTELRRAVWRTPGERLQKLLAIVWWRLDQLLGDRSGRFDEDDLRVVSRIRQHMGTAFV
jgi:hypothetical protein